MPKKEIGYFANFEYFFSQFAVLLISALLFLSVGTADASWLLNPAEFHASAHGRTACTDCHYHVTDQPLHPNPAAVTENEMIFFHADQCLDCHDDVMENLDNGVHGSKKVEDKVKYGNCLNCHRPHNQPFLGEDRSGAYQPGKPAETQCGACHEKMSTLPPFFKEDAACMKCHQTRNTENPHDVRAIQDLCFHCHGKGRSRAQAATSKFIPLMDETSYTRTPHKHLACTVCHENAAAFAHDHQESVNCRRCHASHIEKETDGAHLDISCQTCHLKGIVPFFLVSSRGAHGAVYCLYPLQPTAAHDPCAGGHIRQCRFVTPRRPPIPVSSMMTVTAKDGFTRSDPATKVNWKIS